mmetsp:Transcript_28900/g.91250  ORF Transcript_28900/g.91250 Transcript_28900/m.91250 type:complete len:360 (-) Transcript_28900:21-1100(-)
MSAATATIIVIMDMAMLIMILAIALVVRLAFFSEGGGLTCSPAIPRGWIWTPSNQARLTCFCESRRALAPGRLAQACPRRRICSLRIRDGVVRHFLLHAGLDLPAQGLLADLHPRTGGLADLGHLRLDEPQDLTPVHLLGGPARGELLLHARQNLSLVVLQARRQLALDGLSARVPPYAPRLHPRRRGGQRGSASILLRGGRLTCSRLQKRLHGAQLPLQPLELLPRCSDVLPPVLALLANLLPNAHRVPQGLPDHLVERVDVLLVSHDLLEVLRARRRLFEPEVVALIILFAPSGGGRCGRPLPDSVEERPELIGIVGVALALLLHNLLQRLPARVHLVRRLRDRLGQRAVLLLKAPP